MTDGVELPLSCRWPRNSKKPQLMSKSRTLPLIAGNVLVGNLYRVWFGEAGAGCLWKIHQFLWESCRKGALVWVLFEWRRGAISERKREMRERARMNHEDRHALLVREEVKRS